MSGLTRAITLQSVRDLPAGHGHDAVMSGMHRAQHQMASGAMSHLHLPSKGTVITIVVLLHVVAMAYLGYALFTAQRRAVPKEKAREPPKRVNCVYEWASLSLPPPGSFRLPLRLTRA